MITLLYAFISLLLFGVRGRASLELELIALRQQLSVLRRQRAGRLWLFSADRLLWVWLYRLWPQSYFQYHPRTRTHLALDKDCPQPRPIQPPSTGKIIALPEVGGPHHRYEMSRRLISVVNEPTRRFRREGRGIFQPPCSPATVQ